MTGDGSLAGMHQFASVVLVDPRGWVLLQERDSNPAIDPDRWGFSGGHLEPGETPEEGAYRELEEETGLRLPAGTLRLWQSIEVFHEAYHSDDVMHLFAAATDATDDDIDCQEGRRIVFVEPGRAMQLPLTAATAIALPLFLDSPDYSQLKEQS